MDELLSKFQYKNYEPGEFSEIAERTLAETLERIKAYPWLEQTHLVSIGLTSPSVTIEDGSGNYLKIGHYYNDQFCLYLFTASGHYYRKNALTMDVTLDIITSFFNGNSIVQGFTKMNSIGVEKHFITKDFIYKVDSKRIFWFMLDTMITTMIFTIGLGFAFWLNMYFGLVTLVLWMFVCGINWLLFINYYRNCKDMFMKISKGQTKFLFGTRESHKEYDKKDITSYLVYGPHKYSKGPPWLGFEISEITFSNGEKIRYTSLLLGMFQKNSKFDGVDRKRVNVFLPVFRKEKQ